jgi:hypothetical protein
MSTITPRFGGAFLFNPQKENTASLIEVLFPMKKLLFLSLLFLAPVALFAQTPPALTPPYHLSAYVGYETGGYFDFPQVSAAGPTGELDLHLSLMKTHTVEVSYASGTNTACTVQLEGSSNGTNWYSLQTSPTTCTSNVMWNVVNFPVRFLRVNVLTYTGTGVLDIQYTGVK